MERARKKNKKNKKNKKKRKKKKKSRNLFYPVIVEIRSTWVYEGTVD
jgi:hypothetical protein